MAKTPSKKAAKVSTLSSFGIFCGFVVRFIGGSRAVCCQSRLAGGNILLLAALHVVFRFDMFCIYVYVRGWRVPYCVFELVWVWSCLTPLTKEIVP